MGHGKGRRRHAEKPVAIQLPITAMLDMSFQLLAFFVLTFKTAGVAEGQLEMFLPAAGQAKAAAPADADPFAISDKDPEQQSDVTVKVEASGTAIGKLGIVTKEGTVAAADVKELQAKLADVRKGLANQTALKVESEGDLRYAFLIDVVDACRKAGFTSVGFAPPTDLGR